MANFPIHTLETAPEAARPLLEASLKANGRIPGLHGVMAAAPALLEAYQATGKAFLSTSLTNEEKTVVWMAVNVEQNCRYCVPAHTGIAKMMKVDDAIIEALRDETPLPTPKLEALRDFTLNVVRGRGFVDDADTQAFLDAGFTHRRDFGASRRGGMTRSGGRVRPPHARGISRHDHPPSHRRRVRRDAPLAHQRLASACPRAGPDRHAGRDPPAPVRAEPRHAAQAAEPVRACGRETRRRARTVRARPAA